MLGLDDLLIFGNLLGLPLIGEAKRDAGIKKT